MLAIFSSISKYASGKKLFESPVASTKRLQTTILDKTKWNSKSAPPPPPSQIKDEAAQEPKRTIFPSLILSKIVDRNINKGSSIIYCEIDQVRGHYWFTEQSGFSYSRCFVMWTRISTAHGRETITHHVGVYFLLWNQNCFFLVFTAWVVLRLLANFCFVPVVLCGAGEGDFRFTNVGLWDKRAVGELTARILCPAGCSVSTW